MDKNLIKYCVCVCVCVYMDVILRDILHEEYRNDKAGNVSVT